MPGVLTAEEVEALDLDHWLLLVRGSFVHMVVRCPFFLPPGLPGWLAFILAKGNYANW